jgi:hypothetical protein
MAKGALPKGHVRPSDSGSQGGSSSSAPKKRGADKLGISIAIGITAAALIIGIGFAGVLPIGEELSSLMPPSTTTPVAQQAPSSYTPMQSSPSYGSYATSDRDLIDQLDWSISTGDVVAMYLDKGSSSLIIHTDTVDDGELFVGLNADYIGSDDGTFFIIVDNQEHEDYEQAGMDLYIDLPAGTETVEIIGSYVIL